MSWVKWTEMAISTPRRSRPIRLYSEEAIRSAASTDGTNLWISGASSGLRYTVRGASIATQLINTVTNTRQLNIFSNQLYFSSSAIGPNITLGTAGGQPPPTNSWGMLRRIFLVTRTTPAIARMPFSFSIWEIARRTSIQFISLTTAVLVTHRGFINGRSLATPIG